MAQDRNGNNHKATGRPDGGQFDRKAGQGSDDDLDFGTADARLAAAMPGLDADARRRLIGAVRGADAIGAPTFTVCADHDDWLERRALTPGCSDARSVLMEGRVRPPLDVEPGSYLESILEFGHRWEPRIAAEYARREGFEQVPDDTPIEDLRLGQLTRHELGMIERDGVVHASLDAVQRERDGSVTIVEIKTGGRDSFEELKTGQRDGYLAQATVEWLVAGADRARVVYAQRPYGFDKMEPGELEAAVLGSMDAVDADEESCRSVRLADGTSLADLDMPRLEAACRAARKA